jgi:hypothetical protein
MKEISPMSSFNITNDKLLTKEIIEGVSSTADLQVQQAVENSTEISKQPQDLDAIAAATTLAFSCHHYPANNFAKYMR